MSEPTSDAAPEADVTSAKTDAATEPTQAPPAPEAAPPSSDAAGASSAAPDPNAQIEELRRQLLEARHALRQREAELEASQGMGRQTLDRLKDQHERVLRATADLENYKKRAARERDEIAQYGQEKLLREMLTVVDNLDRALEHAKGPDDYESLRAGLEMTRKQFENTLGKFGVKGFSALNGAFDPTLHEAVQQAESDKAPGTVVQELVRGFTLQGRLMRPAMVVVAKARPEPSRGAGPDPKAPPEISSAPPDEAEAAQAPESSSTEDTTEKKGARTRTLVS